MSLSETRKHSLASYVGPDDAVDAVTKGRELQDQALTKTLKPEIKPFFWAHRSAKTAKRAGSKFEVSELLAQNREARNRLGAAIVYGR